MHALCYSYWCSKKQNVVAQSSTEFEHRHMDFTTPGKFACSFAKTRCMSMYCDGQVAVYSH